MGLNFKALTKTVSNIMFPGQHKKHALNSYLFCNFLTPLKGICRAFFNKSFKIISGRHD